MGPRIFLVPSSRRSVVIPSLSVRSCFPATHAGRRSRRRAQCSGRQHIRWDVYNKFEVQSLRIDCHLSGATLVIWRNFRAAPQGPPFASRSQCLIMLSSVLRYSAFVAGALLVFVVAVGMGAGAAVVVDWQDDGAG